MCYWKHEYFHENGQKSYERWFKNGKFIKEEYHENIN